MGMNRAVSGFAVAALIGFSSSAGAECFGKYPATMCVSDYGDVWVSSGGGYYGGGYYGSYSYRPRDFIARSPSAGTGRVASTPSANWGATGVTTLMKPSAQTGNAWVVTPSSSGGATVLNGASSAPAP
jgi:hypothetical protein